MASERDRKVSVPLEEIGASLQLSGDHPLKHLVYDIALLLVEIRDLLVEQRGRNKLRDELEEYPEHLRAEIATIRARGERK